MNIFYLDPNPKICAEMHLDKHVVKMILEYAQLLSTAHRILDGRQEIEKRYVAGSLPARWRNVKVWKLDDARDNILYSATHANHPSAIWVRQSDQNYIWLCNMLLALCEEYTHRYGKVHKVERDGLAYVLLKNVPKNITKGFFTTPTPAMPDEVKIPNDSLASYRNYYIHNKAHMAKWTKRDMPLWFKQGTDSINANL